MFGEISELSEDYRIVILLYYYEDLVTFKVKESLADSYSCHIAVEATLKNTDKYLLVPAEHEVDKNSGDYVSAT